MSFNAAMTLAAAEKLNDVANALDKGELCIAMSSGRWWRLRRNGRTRLWATRPEHWAIPVKYGLKGYATIDHTWRLGVEYDYAVNIPEDRRT